VKVDDWLFTNGPQLAGTVPQQQLVCNLDDSCRQDVTLPTRPPSVDFARPIYTSRDQIQLQNGPRWSLCVCWPSLTYPLPLFHWRPINRR